MASGSTGVGGASNESHVQRSTGTQPSVMADTSGGVVRDTPANNRAGMNPGGVGAQGVRAPNSPTPTPGGRRVVGIKGRTVAGTGKVIGG